MNKTFASVVICLHLCAALAIAQTGQSARPVEQADDVVKVYTELVQTDVMVFDKQGHFVNDPISPFGRPSSLSYSGIRRTIQISE